MPKNVYLDPDFVIVGVAQSDGKVMVVASTTLTAAEIEAIWADDPPDPFKIGGFRFGPPRVVGYRVGTTMHDLAIVTGATYAEALRTLFAAWTPPTEPAVPQRALPGPYG